MAAGEGLSFDKVLSAGYMKGAPVELPATFRPYFPATTDVVLKSKGGGTVDGRVTCSTTITKSRVEGGKDALKPAMKLTKGFPQFRRQFELAEGDAVRFVLEPVAGSHALPAIRILLLSRGNVNLAAAKRRRSLERKAGSPAALAAVGKRKHAKQESRDPGQHSLEAQGDHEHAAAATECKPLAAPTDEQPSLRNSSPDGGERQQPRPAKRPRAAAAAAAAAAVAEQLCDSSDTDDEDSGSVGGNECSRQLWERQGGQQAPLAAAAAFSLEDVLHATVLLPLPKLPNTPCPRPAWLAAHVTAVATDGPGWLTLQLLHSGRQEGVGEAAAAGGQLPRFRLQDVAAKLPDGLIGWALAKRFPEHNNEEFRGIVEGFEQQGAQGSTLYKIRYADGDSEDLELHELLPLLLAAPPQHTLSPAAAPPAGSKARPALAKPAPPATAGCAYPHAAAAAGGAALLLLEATPSAVEESRAGVYAASGAGHDRGALAYDKENDVMRPVGPWIAHPEKGTVLGRAARLDKRHLADRQLGDGTVYRSSSVPGWIGVVTEEAEGNWHPDYKGKYRVVFWDTQCATKRAVRSAAHDSVEEAARLYDRIALSYCGNTADTNYPPTQQLLQQLGEQEEGASRHIIPLAARLLGIEQGIPFDALPDAHQDAEVWAAWEADLLDNYMCRRATTQAPAQLAAKLKWMLERVLEVAVLPAYRGAPLQAFLQACEACTEGGTTKTHYTADSADCMPCASNTKAGGGRTFCHGSTSLFALIREVEVAILSQGALHALQEGASEREVAAAAEDEQQELDDLLAVWRGGAPATTAAGSAAGRRRQSNGGGGGGKQRRRASGRAAPVDAEKDVAAAVLWQYCKAVPPGLKVVVIGAGVAGLKVACDLQRAGVEATVLEARDRIGGRIHTHTLCAGGMLRRVGLGASFICGTSRKPPVNPMLQYASDVLGLQLRPKQRDGPLANVLYGGDYRRVPDCGLDEVEERYAELLEAALERGATAEQDETLEQAFASILDSMELEEGQREIMQAFLADLYGTSLDSMSLRGMVSSGYQGAHELVVGGYQQVVEALADGRVDPGLAPLPLRDLRYKAVVRSVTLLAGGVGAQVEVEGQEEPLWCHTVVCTLPLGCLQKKTVAFTPALPAYKQQAIDGLGMGTENRVAMLFEEVFWPEEPHALRPLAGRYTFCNLHALGVGNVLCAWVRPQATAAYESMSDEEVLSDVGATLHKMFPESYRPPLAHTITRWQQDPFSHGAYSFVPQHGRREFYDWLSFPVSGDAVADATQVEQGGKDVRLETRLWFAGEACSKDDACTVHGAFTTARNQAVRIKRWWRAFHAQIEQQLQQLQQQEGVTQQQWKEQQQQQQRQQQKQQKEQQQMQEQLQKQQQAQPSANGHSGNVLAPKRRAR